MVSGLENGQESDTNNKDKPKQNFHSKVRASIMTEIRVLSSNPKFYSPQDKSLDKSIRQGCFVLCHFNFPVTFFFICSERSEQVDLTNLLHL